MAKKTKLTTAKAVAKVGTTPAAKATVPKSAASRKKRADKTQSQQAMTPADKSKTGNSTKLSKADKPKKVKLVRDCYTMPENDYAKFVELKKKCLKTGVHVKKSELLRAGLITLDKLSVADLLRTVARLEKVKTGRPGKH